MPKSKQDPIKKNPCSNCGQYHSHTSNIIAKLKNTPFYRFKDIYLSEFEKFRGEKEKKNLPSWFREDDETASKKENCKKLILEERLNESSIVNKDIESNIETSRQSSIQNSNTVKKITQNKRHFISNMDLVKSRNKTLHDNSIQSQNQESERSLKANKSQSKIQNDIKSKNNSIASKSSHKSNIMTTVHQKSQVWHNFIEKRSRRQERNEGLINEVNCFQYNCGEEASGQLMSYSDFKPQDIIPLEQKKFQPASVQKNLSIAQVHLSVIDSLNSHSYFQNHYKINIYLDNWK